MQLHKGDRPKQLPAWAVEQLEDRGLIESEHVIVSYRETDENGYERGVNLAGIELTSDDDHVDDSKMMVIVPYREISRDGIALVRISMRDISTVVSKIIKEEDDDNE